MGKPESRGSEVKDKLKKMTLSELKTLAKRYKVTAKGKIEEGLFSDRRIAQTKAQYVNALSKRLSEEDVRIFLK